MNKRDAFSDRILSLLLPERPLSGWGRRLLVALLVLSPAAYFGGLLLQSWSVERQQLGFAVDRDQAIAAARDFAAAKGISTEDWRTFVVANTDDTLHAYHRLPQNANRDDLKQLAPGIVIRVAQAFYGANSQKPQLIDTYLRPDGAVVGYLLQFDDDAQVEVGEAETLELAKRTMMSRAGISALGAEAPKIASKDEPGINRVYLGHASPPDRPELRLEFKVGIRNGQVVEDRVEAKLTGSFVDAHLSDYTFVKIFVQILAGCVGAVLVVYCFVRYIRRTQQKEISHRRSFVLAGVMTAAWMVLLLLNISDSVGLGTVTAPWWVLWFAIGSMLVVYAFLSLLLGTAWCAVESDLREVYPEKLVSIDTMAAGRALSQNASKALLVGTALAGWLLLVSMLVQLPWTTNPYSGESPQNMGVLVLARAPWLFALMSPVTNAPYVVVLGLLAPLSLVRKRLLTPGVQKLAIAFTVGLSANLLFGVFTQPFAAGVIATVLTTAGFFAIFFAYDLLAAVAAMGAFIFAGALAVIAAAVSDPGLNFIMGCSVALVAVTTWLVFAFRGRRFSEKEVRPLYAHHQAERQAMQAEVSAARQAQLRLTPTDFPKVPGVSLAAACRPARVVGGDFFDFFPIDEDRLGILLAEGGGQGLSSALAIAYAKGLLMPIVQHRTPTEIVRRLRASLTPLLDQSGRMGVLYAVVDSGAPRLDYARFGAYPRLLVSGAETPRETVIDENDQGRPPGQPAIVRAGIRLSPGARMILFTDGVAETLEVTQRSAKQWMTDFLESRRTESAREIHEAFLQAIDKRVRKARRQGVDDDISSVLLRLDSVTKRTRAPMPKEEVA